MEHSACRSQHTVRVTSDDTYPSADSVSMVSSRLAPRFTPCVNVSNRTVMLQTDPQPFPFASLWAWRADQAGGSTERQLVPTAGCDSRTKHLLVRQLLCWCGAALPAPRRPACTIVLRGRLADRFTNPIKAVKRRWHRVPQRSVNRPRDGQSNPRMFQPITGCSATTCFQSHGSTCGSWTTAIEVSSARHSCTDDRSWLQYGMIAMSSETTAANPKRSRELCSPREMRIVGKGIERLNTHTIIGSFRVFSEERRLLS